MSSSSSHGGSRIRKTFLSATEFSRYDKAKGGPAIFGYGSIVGAPARRSGTLRAPVEFDVIVDPETEVLVTRKELSAIPSSSKYWRTQSSGILLPQPGERSTSSSSTTATELS